MDMMKMMAQAKEMAEKVKAAQDKVTHIQVMGAAGIDEEQVTVKMDGRHQVLAVNIPAKLIGSADPDAVAFLQDLVAAAFNDAVAKVEKETKDVMGGAMGGMQLPPGMKLPF